MIDLMNTILSFYTFLFCIQLLENNPNVFNRLGLKETSQSQKAVSAYLKSNQILPFDFARQNMSRENPIQTNNNYAYRATPRDFRIQTMLSCGSIAPSGEYSEHDLFLN